MKEGIHNFGVLARRWRMDQLVGLRRFEETGKVSGLLIDDIDYLLGRLELCAADPAVSKDSVREARASLASFRRQTAEKLTRH